MCAEHYAGTLRKTFQVLLPDGPQTFVFKSGEFGVVVYYRSQGIEGLSFGIVKEFFGIADSPDYTSAESGVTVYFDIERHFLLNINLRIFL